MMELIDLIARLENNAIHRVETQHGVLQGYFITDDEMLFVKRYLRKLTKEGKTMNYLNQFFEYEHLPDHLQAVSKKFALLAAELQDLPDNPEKTTALRKLLEAKDCAVRAVIFKQPQEEV